MSRIREDYEQSLWRKIVRFVNGEELESHANKQTEQYENLEQESMQEAVLAAKQFDAEAEKEEAAPAKPKRSSAKKNAK